MIKCYIEGKNLIDGTPEEYRVADGPVFIENYNETLDSGTIILPQLTHKIDIKPYDVIVVYTTDDSNVAMNERRLLVDTAVCDTTCLYPPLYKYTISLFSETKLLEGILLPSLAITKLKVGTPEEYRTVWDYLDIYLKLYNTKIGMVDGDFVGKYSYADGVQARFSKITCPELQWNEPTFREVLTDLMMVADCIPIVRNNKIDYINISQTGTEITPEQKKRFNYIRESISAADFVSEIKNSLHNATGNESVKICENIGFRNNDVYILTTENVRVETSLPIWNLLSARMRFNAQVKINITRKDSPSMTPIKYWWATYYELSIAPFILEYSEWVTKNIYYASVDGFAGPSPNYQNTSLYFKRGEKGIHNFNAKQEGNNLWINQVKFLLNLLMTMKTPSTINGRILSELNADATFQSQFPSDVFNYAVDNEANMQGDWRTSQFNVEYEALAEHTFFASKSPIQTNKRQIVDNQSQSYVDVNRQGMLEYLKANRLGNLVKLANGRFETDESEIPQLGQKIDDKSIIFRKEIEVHENFINVNYQATENYVLRDYFTGIKSKARSWRTLSGNEAFLRAENIKFYYNNNLESIGDPEEVLPGEWLIPIYKDDPTTAENPQTAVEKYLSNFNYCSVVFLGKNGDSYPDSNVQFQGSGVVNAYLFELQKTICGKSILFTIKAIDNAIVGKYISDNEYDYGSGRTGMTQKDCRYVDDDGEFENGVIFFHKEISASTVEQKCLMPAVDAIFSTELTNLVAMIPFRFYKDNKEIFQLTIQFEYNDEANDVFLGYKPED